MRIPDEFGLERGWNYEVIITISGNAAPVGIHTSDFESIDMEVYKTSGTCRNLLKEKRFVINFVDDVNIFYKSIFEKGDVEFKGNHLRDADAFIEMEITERRDLGDRVGIRAVPRRFGIRRKPGLVNRAKSLVLESMIAKTRLPHVPAREREFLDRKIQENLRVVRKVAPGSEFERILERL